MKNIYRIILVLVIALATIFVAPSSDGQTWKQWDRARVNSLRATHNERPLVYNYRLQREAQLWAEKMATSNLIRQNFNAGPCWAVSLSTRVFGDNVGLGPTVPLIQREWEHSPSHRANMLDPQYRYLGIGIAYGRGWVWMDQVFCG